MAMVYDLPTVDASAQPIQQFQAPESRNMAAEQAGQMGQAVSKLGEAAMQIEDMRAEAATQKHDIELVQHLQNLETQYFQLKNEDAVNARESVLKNAQDKAAELKSRASGGIERSMLSPIIEKRLASFAAGVDKFYIGNLDTWNKELANSRVKNAGTAMYGKWSFYGKQEFDDAKKELDDRIKEKAIKDHIGLDTDVYAALKRKELTPWHVQTIDALASNNRAADAKAYLSRFKDEIEAADREKLEETIKTAGVKDDSLRLTRKIADKPIDEQRTELGKLFDEGKISAEVYDASITRIDHAAVIQKAQKAEAEKNILTEAQNWLIDHPGASATDLPPDMTTKLRAAGHYDTIFSFAKHSRYTHNEQEWARFLTKTPQQLAAMTTTDVFNKFRGSFDDDHLERAELMVAHAREQVLGAGSGGVKKDAEPKLTRTITLEGMKTNAAQNAGILPYTGQPTEKQAKDYNTFERIISDRVLNFELNDLRGERKATDKEIQNIIDGVALDTAKVKTGLLSRAEKPISLMSKEELKNATVTVSSGKEIKLSSIPAGDRARYVSILTANSITPTEQKVAEMYVLERSKGKPAAAPSAPASQVRQPVTAPRPAAAPAPGTKQGYTGAEAERIKAKEAKYQAENNPRAKAIAKAEKTGANEYVTATKADGSTVRTASKNATFNKNTLAWEVK